VPFNRFGGEWRELKRNAPELKRGQKLLCFCRKIAAAILQRSCFPGAMKAQEKARFIDQQ